MKTKGERAVTPYHILKIASASRYPYFDIICFQTPSPGVHQAHLRRGHLLPRADRAKRGDGFRRGEHQSAVEVGAGAHESGGGFSS